MMEKKIYKNPTMQEHDVEVEKLMIDATSGDSTDQQLGKMRGDLSERVLREQESTEYGNLW